MTRWATIAAAVLVATGAILAAGGGAKEKEQDTEALINKGLKAYKEGKPQEAIAALQAAIGAIQKSLQKGLERFFPAAPEGWEAAEIRSDSGAFTTDRAATAITNLSRTYTKKGEGGAQVTVSLVNAREIVEAQRTLADSFRKNPAILQAMQTEGTKFTLVEQDGWTGWKTVEKGHEAKIIVFSQSSMLEIAANKDDEAALDLLFKLIDLKGLAAALPAPAATPAK